MGFPGDLVVMKLQVNAGDVDSIPGSERSPEEEMATQSSISVWETPWAEEPGGLESVVSQRLTHTQCLSIHA